MQPSLGLLLGWAKRQMSQFDVAEKLLHKSTTPDPNSSRFFELGKMYQARGQADKATVSYSKALAQLFVEAETTISPVWQQEQESNISKRAVQ
jgi:Flp pilus assembly protein TadD